MSTEAIKIVQPLNGEEIRKGIAARISQSLPVDVQDSLRQQIYDGLQKTCSLNPNLAYAKFKSKWTLTWWKVNREVHSNWWVDYQLDDFGKVTSGGFGDKRKAPSSSAETVTGEIDETPPDRFRRETDQPIPKPIELKPAEEKSTFSKSLKGSGKRRSV